MTDQEVLEHLQSLRGLVATIVLTGTVEENFSQALSDMRSWCDRSGFHNIEWRKFPAQLVETGRDSALQHALEEEYDFVLQVDADAYPIPPDALARILHDAYIKQPEADVVGGYCQLKNAPYLPTIDTGTGTWEPIFPGEGLVPVIRTGGHFILVKVPLLKQFGPPWFRTRETAPSLKALAEVDNFARCKLDGKNPLRDSPAWEELVEIARSEQGPGISSVGEDSGFCDAARASGAEIYVDTDLVIGHMSKRVIMPSDLRDEMRKRRRGRDLALGVYE